MYAYTDKVQFLSKENLHNVLEKVLYNYALESCWDIKLRVPSFPNYVTKQSIFSKSEYFICFFDSY